VLAQLAHEQGDRVGHAGEVGLEAKLGLGLCRVGAIRTDVELLRVHGHSRDLDPARLELGAQKRELVVVEFELDRLRLELGRVDDAVLLDLVDEAPQFIRVKRRVDLVLLSYAVTARSRRRSKRSIRLPLAIGRSTPVYTG